jgi:hypothetical protein
MVSIFQPRFPTQPSPAGATVATTTFPTELAPFIKDILEKSKAQQEGAAYQAYTGPQLAQFTDAEKAAMDAMRQQTTGLAGTDIAQATPYFTGAKTALEGLGQQFTGDTAQQFMNPYQQAVVDQAKRKAIEDYERVTAPTVTAQAIAQQPFGGSRQAIAEGMAREALQEQLSDIQERGLSQAFTQGRAAFEAQKARELQQAQQLSQLGQTVPQQALRDLAVQQQLGEQERQQEQLALDLAKGQFMEEREFPTRALQEYSAIVRGFPFQPSTYQTSTQYQATPSVASQLLQLGGTGLGAYTAFTGKPLGNLFGMANQGGGIADIISNQMGENEQISMKARNDYIQSARGDTIEHLNRYGVGGTKRKEVEGLIPDENLPDEVAPFRTDEVMTESAVGAPMGGPLPSREEVDMMEKNRLLKERDMRRMFNQGGMITPSLSKAYVDSLIEDPAITDEQFQNVTGFQSKQEYLDTPNYGESFADQAKNFIIPQEGGLPTIKMNLGSKTDMSYMLGGPGAPVLIDGKYVYPDDENFPEDAKKSPANRRVTFRELLEKQRPDMARSVQEDPDEILKTGPGVAGNFSLSGTQLGQTLEEQYGDVDSAVTDLVGAPQAETTTDDGTDIDYASLLSVTRPDLKDINVNLGETVMPTNLQNVDLPDAPTIREDFQTRVDPKTGTSRFSDYESNLRQFREMMAGLSSKERLDQLKKEAETNKNVNLGLSMMKAFGKARKPGLSLAQTAADIGADFATEVEPGMKTYREELKEIDNIPFETAQILAGIDKDLFQAGEGVASRDIQTQGLEMQKFNVVTSNLIDINKALDNLNLGKQELDLKKKQLKMTADISNNDNALKLYTASITEKSNIADLIQANKELERDLLKDGIVDVSEKKQIDETIVQAIHGNKVTIKDGELEFADDYRGTPQMEEAAREVEGYKALLTSRYKLYKEQELLGGESAFSRVNTDLNKLAEAKDFIQSVDFKNKITQNPQLGKLYDKFNNKLQKSTSFGLHPYEIQQAFIIKYEDAFK